MGLGYYHVPQTILRQVTFLSTLKIFFDLKYIFDGLTMWKEDIIISSNTKVQAR